MMENKALDAADSMFAQLDHRFHHHHHHAGVPGWFAQVEDE